MRIDAEQINHVAKLARLSLSADEVNEFSDQLSAIIDYVEKVNQLETDSVAPAEHIAGIKNVFREDITEPSLAYETLTELAPSFENGHFIVPRIIE